MNSRRDFIKKAGAGTLGFAIGGIFPDINAFGQSRIIGSNERVNMAIVGVNSRGDALATNFARQANCEVVSICDVDTRAIEKCIASVSNVQMQKPKGERDFRKVLEDKQVDAVAIAMPDHWHTPAALMALQAGKHVYLEKPVSYCPKEGEMLMEAAAKYGKKVQIGTQRRSWPRVVEAIQQIHEGVIGKVHFGKGWYVNDRPSIGTGNIVAVPEWLDWDLWQGPAPRKVYKDNIVHYNWHWFWHWGTAETLNNGSHMIDLLCWGMNLKYPTKVSSIGGRYYYNDEWETPDTQTVNMEFGKEASLLWEGQSANGKQIENSSAGVIFYGDGGSLLISIGNDYKIFDKKNKLIKDVKSNIQSESQGTIGPGDALDAIHILNFLDGIRTNISLKTTVETGHKCALLMQLANISLRTGRMLNTDPNNGRIINDSEAQQYWSRSYEPGWEPKI